MNITLSDLLEESIRIELNAGKLYRLYSELFPDDSDFWMRISLEEMNHASLLKSARQFLRLGKLPEESIYQNFEALEKMNMIICSHIEQFSAERPGKEKAYAFAKELETSAAEQHFQNIMKGHEDNKVLDIFRRLAGQDIDHASRIEGLIQKAKDR